MCFAIDVIGADFAWPKYCRPREDCRTRLSTVDPGIAFVILSVVLLVAGGVGEIHLGVKTGNVLFLGFAGLMILAVVSYFTGLYVKVEAWKTNG